MSEVLSQKDDVCSETFTGRRHRLSTDPTAARLMSAAGRQNLQHKLAAFITDNTHWVFSSFYSYATRPKTQIINNWLILTKYTGLCCLICTVRHR